LLLSDKECSEAGPAWLLQQPGLFCEGWKGDPEIFPFGPIIPIGNEPPKKCIAWEKATGDAGWAGQLLKAFRAPEKLPSYIIYKPGTDVLVLMREVVALLPADERWQATFSTYFSNLPPNSTCGWRCVLSESAAARGARRPGVLAIDLTKELSRSPENEYAMAARSGQTITLSASVPPLQVRSPVKPDEAETKDSVHAPTTVARTPAPYGLEPAHGGVERVKHGHRIVRDEWSKDSNRVPRTSRIWLVLGWSGWVCAGVLAAAMLFLFGHAQFEKSKSDDSLVITNPPHELAIATPEESQVKKADTIRAPEPQQEPLSSEKSVDHASESSKADPITEQPSVDQEETQPDSAPEIVPNPVGAGKDELQLIKREFGNIPISGRGVFVGSISATDNSPADCELNRHSPNVFVTMYDAKSNSSYYISDEIRTPSIRLDLFENQSGLSNVLDKTELTTVTVVDYENTIIAKVNQPINVKNVPDASIVLSTDLEWAAIHTRKTDRLQEVSPKAQGGESKVIRFDISEIKLQNLGAVYLLPPWVRDDRSSNTWLLALQDNRGRTGPVDELVLKWNQADKQVSVELRVAAAYPSQPDIQRVIKKLKAKAKSLDEDKELKNKGVVEFLNKITNSLEKISKEAPIKHAVDAANSHSSTILYDKFGRPWVKLKLHFKSWNSPEPGTNGAPK